MKEYALKSDYIVIGLMSGTSLDGLDVVLCDFNYKNGKWHHSIVNAAAFAYDNTMYEALNDARYFSEKKRVQLHNTYGKWIAGAVNDFLSFHRIKHENVDFIASHGHTVFHQPESGYTLQIGDGKTIAEICGIPVVYDFRTDDLTLGGQGAPLVPVGDVMLFPDYDQCLNIGGFSNITDKSNDIKAWDICPVNTILNDLAGNYGKSYDSNGNIGRNGKVLPAYLEAFENLDFYHKPPPKSLGREWIDMYIKPVLDDALKENSIQDVMRTWYEHVSFRIGSVLSGCVLITGGGAHNAFLIELIRQKSNAVIYIPDPELVDFKEAIIFAFLGVLRWRNENNVMSTVTGAFRDHSSGKIALY
jgi:anhydro-N-acetylmuramic acid kinase